MNVLRRSRKIRSLRVDYGTQGHGLVAQPLKELPGKIHEVIKEGSVEGTNSNLCNHSG